MTNELTVDQRVKLEGIARDIRMSGKRAALEIINIGRALQEARNILAGGFTKWVESELDMSPRLAENFMNCAYRFGATPEIIAGVPPTILYSLAAPSTSDKVIDVVLNRVASGEKLRVQDVQDIIRESRPAKRTVEQVIEDTADDIQTEIRDTGGVSLNGDSLPPTREVVEAAVAEHMAENFKNDNDTIRRKMEREQGLEGIDPLRGKCIVDHVNPDGRITLFSPALALELEAKQRLFYLLYILEDEYNRPLSIVGMAASRGVQP